MKTKLTVIFCVAVFAAALGWVTQRRGTGPATLYSTEPSLPNVSEANYRKPNAEDLNKRTENRPVGEQNQAVEIQELAEVVELMRKGEKSEASASQALKKFKTCAEKSKSGHFSSVANLCAKNAFKLGKLYPSLKGEAQKIAAEGNSPPMFTGHPIAPAKKEI